MEEIKIGDFSIARIIFGPIETNTYVFGQDSEVCIVDPAMFTEFEEETALSEIQRRGSLKYIINTHGHFDHISGNQFLKEVYPTSKILIHPMDVEKLNDPFKNGSTLIGASITSPPPDLLLNEGDLIVFSTKKIKVLHTPGHTKGSISLLEDRFIFTGDTLFNRSVGIAKEYKGAFEELISSIKSKLLVLPEGTMVLPGHMGLTSIGAEREENDFLKD